ncbi:MAG: LysM peptidoglycan-binding domain-containing protein [Alphaproteobacteria bacterium]|uniref:LysM peptidoglycan-binding domain-containing protein n=1 Tax=Candidatus Nitrobium versatile TaxID=2884831 RepID=A0A953JFA1_9BACT|nr:LysM peptidoglycan-binding domain-containing protein [Candidatus Nitrobium versatile]
MGKRFAVLFSALFFFLASAVHATTTYTVRQGDTLYKIARHFNVPLAELKAANKLRTHRLNTGTKLVIPGAPSPEKSSGASRQTTTESGKKSEPAVRDNETHYTVRKGDTLKSIARKYSLTPADLKRINNLKSSRLKNGQQLLVRVPEPGSYTVRKGDTMRKIAKKFRMSADELRAINGLPDMTIKAGQKLLLSRKSPEEKGEEKTEEKPLPLSFDGKFSPVIASARIEEVRGMAKSEDILAELSIKERLILFAKKMLHLPYQFGGNGSIGLDCSAYVQKVYGFIGQALPRSAREQFHVGETVKKEQLSTGDLVFFRTYASFPSHVGIYIGNNLFIHASSLSKKITIDSLESPYFLKRYIGARRLLPEEKKETEAEDLSVSVKEN